MKLKLEFIRNQMSMRLGQNDWSVGLSGHGELPKMFHANIRGTHKMSHAKQGMLIAAMLKVCRTGAALKSETCWCTCGCAFFGGGAPFWLALKGKPQSQPFLGGSLKNTPMRVWSLSASLWKENMLPCCLSDPIWPRKFLDPLSS